MSEAKPVGMMRGLVNRMTGIFERRATLENPAVSLDDPSAWHDLFGGGPTKAGVRVSPRTAIGYPPLWRAVALICNAVAKLSLHVYERTPAESQRRATGHPGYYLLRRKPNKSMVAGVWKKTLTYHALLRGNGYSAIWRDALGNPEEILLLDPNSTYPVQTTVGLWYVTAIRGQQVRLPAEDVLHVKGLSFDGLVGHDVIEVMAEALGLGMAAREYGSRFYGEGSNSAGILMIPGNINTEEKVQNVLNDWNKMAKGLNKAHRAALLQDGVKWQPTTISPEQAQALQTRQFEVREVANIIGVPAHMLGDGTSTSYSSLEIESQSFLDNAVDPWLVTWEEECSDKLLTEEEKRDDSHWVEFNRGGLLRADLNTRYRAYSIGRQWGWLSVNDIRRKENEEGIGSAGDVYLEPANMRPAGSEPADEGAADGGGDAVRAAHGELLRERLERLQRVEVEQLRRAAGRPKFASWVQGFYMQHEERLVEALTPAVRAWFAVRGLDNPDAVAGELARDYVEQARMEVMEAAVRGTDEVLGQRIEAVIARRDAGILEELIERVLGA